MAKNLKEVKDANKATIEYGELDAIDFDLIALGKELRKMGVNTSKLLDSCESFEKRISNHIPRDTAPFGQVLFYSVTHMIAMELHIKSTYLQDSEFGDTVLRFCYDHYRGLCIRKGLLDENGKPKE